jgi:transposase
MSQAHFIGLDIAKNVFQVFSADEKGRAIANKKMSRSAMKEYLTLLAPCTIGIEACGTSHYWARTLTAMGHTVKLINPERVKAFLGSHSKTDAADAKAICEALMHLGTRFIPFKTEEQQDTDHLLSRRERLGACRTLP